MDLESNTYRSLVVLHGGCGIFQETKLENNKVTMLMI